MAQSNHWSRLDNRLKECYKEDINREFKQIATAGADTAAGSKFSQKWDTALHCVGSIQP